MIGQRIKSARKLRQRSQKWLAEEVGVTQSSVSEWETGKSGLTVENLSLIAQLLNVNFEWLATGRGEMDSLSDGTISVLPIRGGVAAILGADTLGGMSGVAAGSITASSSIGMTALGLIDKAVDIFRPSSSDSESNYLEPAKIALTEPMPIYSSYTEEQLEFLRLFDALPKSKREVLLTFMRDWINLK